MYNGLIQTVMVAAMLISSSGPHTAAIKLRNHTEATDNGRPKNTGETDRPAGQIGP